jgi:hypothetical protein
MGDDRYGTVKTLRAAEEGEEREMQGMSRSEAKHVVDCSVADLR